MGKIISIANQKGGVGKTTTSVNLSSCLALAGKKVLLIDADPQGNATSGVGGNKNIEKSTYDVIINGEDIKNVIQKCSVENLDVCASNINLAGAEVQLVSQLSREHKLKEALDNLFIECDKAYRNGANILILSDKGVDEGIKAAVGAVTYYAGSSHFFIVGAGVSHNVEHVGYKPLYAYFFFFFLSHAVTSSAR